MRYNWEPLSSGVWRCRLPFLDVTVGVVSGSVGVLLIDCGTTLDEAAGIAADVRQLAGRAVTDVVMTHHHFDHILGSAGFPDARLHAPVPVAYALEARTAELRTEAIRYGASAAEIDAAILRLRAPDRVITHTLMDLGDRIVTIEHPGRGHTDHDLVVVVPAARSGDRPVVFCGDLIEESADPAIDAGSDLSAWPDTVERLLELGGPDARYVPGHGAVVDAEFLRHQGDWLARKP